MSKIASKLTPSKKKMCASRFRPLPAGLAATGKRHGRQAAARVCRRGRTARVARRRSGRTGGEEDDEPEAGLEDAAVEEQTGDDDQIDDPIRIYLMQMGEIPMLNREQETSLARHIQQSRKRFRHNLLVTDYMLQAAVDLLENIRDGRARLDRTIEVSVINLREKRRLLKLLPNVATLKQLMRRNRRELPPGRQQARSAQAAPRSLEAVDVPAGTGRAAGGRTRPADAAIAAGLGPAEAALPADRRRFAAKSANWHGAAKRRRDARNYAQELCHLVRITLESPATLRRRITRVVARAAEYEGASGTSRRATCGWSSPSPSVIATAV